VEPFPCAAGRRGSARTPYGLHPPCATCAEPVRVRGGVVRGRSAPAQVRRLGRRVRTDPARVRGGLCRASEGLRSPREVHAWSNGIPAGSRRSCSEAPYGGTPWTDTPVSRRRRLTAQVSAPHVGLVRGGRTLAFQRGGAAGGVRTRGWREVDSGRVGDRSRSPHGGGQGCPRGGECRDNPCRRNRLASSQGMWPSRGPPHPPGRITSPACPGRTPGALAHRVPHPHPFDADRVRGAWIPGGQPEGSLSLQDRWSSECVELQPASQPLSRELML